MFISFFVSVASNEAKIDDCNLVFIKNIAWFLFLLASIIEGTGIIVQSNGILSFIVTLEVMTEHQIV